jgi:hypothetical protein
VCPVGAPYELMKGHMRGRIPGPLPSLFVLLLSLSPKFGLKFYNLYKFPLVKSVLPSEYRLLSTRVHFLSSHSLSSL